jgi:hypothetical protein
MSSSPASPDHGSPSISLPLPGPVHLIRPEKPEEVTSSSSLPPVIKSWYARFDRPQPARRPLIPDAQSPVAKRTRSGVKRSLSKENLSEGDLTSLFGGEDVSASPVLARLKDTWSSKYSGK